MKHKKRVLSLSLAVVSLFTASASYAGNFEFVVEGEPNLTLVFYGKSSSGDEMFRHEVTDVENRGGKNVYIARIDENIIRASTLVEWCVEDPSGTWQQLSDVEGATTICDARPSETHGTYTFNSPEIVAPVQQYVFGDVLEPVEMDQRSAARCVQRRLNMAGFDAGPIDGAMGNRTRSASVDFLASQSGNPSIEDLSKSTAVLWCNALKFAEENEITVHASSAPTRVKFGTDVDDRTVQHTINSIRSVEQFFQSELGHYPQEQPTVFVSSDPEWLTENYLVDRNLGAAYWRGKRQSFEACNGGEAGYDSLFMCANSNVFSGDWFGSGLAAQRTFALAHEVFHILQFQLVGEKALGCCTSQDTVSIVGPQWLVEGSAEYIAFSILNASGQIHFDREINWHSKKAREIGVSLDKLTDQSGYYSEPNASSAGLIAAHVLHEMVGLSGFVKFWEEMSNEGDWRTAFRNAYGISEETFLREYYDFLGVSAPM